MFRMFFLFILMMLVYQWRYKFLNALLAVGFIRKLAVRTSMAIPQVRGNLLPALFGGEQFQTEKSNAK
ncbi:MAG TPA: hypothetical protein VK057_07300 [Bacillota bacterium]|nr:hypothetical protein [Bacillota bacterium]